MSIFGKILLTAYYIYGCFMYEDDMALMLWVVLGFIVVSAAWIDEDKRKEKEKEKQKDYDEDDWRI